MPDLTLFNRNERLILERPAYESNLLEAIDYPNKLNDFIFTLATLEPSKLSAIHKALTFVEAQPSSTYDDYYATVKIETLAVLNMNLTPEEQSALKYSGMFIDSYFPKSKGYILLPEYLSVFNEYIQVLSEDLVAGRYCAIPTSDKNKMRSLGFGKIAKGMGTIISAMHNAKHLFSGEYFEKNTAMEGSFLNSWATYQGKKISFNPGLLNEPNPFLAFEARLNKSVEEGCKFLHSDNSLIGLTIANIEHALNLFTELSQTKDNQDLDIES